MGIEDRQFPGWADAEAEEPEEWYWQPPSRTADTDCPVCGDPVGRRGVMCALCAWEKSATLTAIELADVAMRGQCVPGFSVVSSVPGFNLAPRPAHRDYGDVELDEDESHDLAMREQYGPDYEGSGYDR